MFNESELGFDQNSRILIRPYKKTRIRIRAYNRKLDPDPSWVPTRIAGPAALHLLGTIIQNAAFWFHG